ncbi:glycosyltransferase family 2 protein [Dermacoccaceae bacterium W4C1]
MSTEHLPSVGAVVLSMGDRPQALAEALASLQRQQGVDLDVLVVGNGWQPTGLPQGVRSSYEPQNLGIPGGRNVGAEQVRGDYLFFFDDDATIVETDVLARLVDVIAGTDGAALCQPGLTDPDTGEAPRRWVPRLRVRPGQDQGGQVASFSEGVVMVRRDAFVQAGGWPGEFFFGHEGIELAWQLVEAGWSLWYAPQIKVHHPYTEAARHAVYYRTNARNRVWVARRNLPAPLVPLYLGTWVGLTLARERDRQNLRVWFSGFAEGVRRPAGARRPISWRAVRELTRAGRPPVI